MAVPVAEAAVGCEVIYRHSHGQKYVCRSTPSALGFPPSHCPAQPTSSVRNIPAVLVWSWCQHVLFENSRHCCGNMMGFSETGEQDTTQNQEFTASPSALLQSLQM